MDKKYANMDTFNNLCNYAEEVYRDEVKRFNETYEYLLSLACSYTAANPTKIVETYVNKNKSKITVVWIAYGSSTNEVTGYNITLKNSLATDMFICSIFLNYKEWKKKIYKKIGRI